MPKFLNQPQYPDLTLIGQANSARVIPLHLMRINPTVMSYETLFSFEGPDGQMMAAAYPGSYGPYLQMAGNPRA